MPVYVWFALAACLLYAIENIIIERYLSQVSALVMMTTSSILMVALTATLLCTKGRAGLALTYPDSVLAWRMLLLEAVLAGIAGYCFFKAYNTGGNASVIPIIVVSMPVFAHTIKAGLSMTLPQPREIADVILVAIAVWLVSTAPRTP